MQVSILGSGSTGNSAYIEADGVGVLVDCGLTVPELGRRLFAIGRDLTRLAAVLITHDHGDHVGSSVALARRLGIPIHATPGTASVLRRVPENLLRPVKDGVHFTIGGFEVRPFATPHDGIEPVGYRVTHTASGRSMGVATDLGYVSRHVVDELMGVHLLVAEHNHDEAMLRDGPYPESLKRRIRGGHGHLSNEQGATLVSHVMHAGLQQVVLAHLSETNNTPDHAVRAFEKFNRDAPSALQVHVAQPKQPSPVFTV